MAHGLVNSSEQATVSSYDHFMMPTAVHCQVLLPQQSHPPRIRHHPLPFRATIVFMPPWIVVYRLIYSCPSNAAVVGVVSGLCKCLYSIALEPAGF